MKLNSVHAKKNRFFPGFIAMLKAILQLIAGLELKNAILVLRFRLLRSFFLTSNIPRSKSIKYKFKESNILKEKGFIILPKLKDSLVENLITQYKSNCKRSFGKDYNEVINDLHKNNKVRGAFCNLMPSAEIAGIIKEVLPIVQDSLKVPRDRIRIRLMCDTLIAPKNEPIYKERWLSDYDDALRFHRDFDGLRFLKYFIFLSDCDKDKGAHYLVKGSAQKGFLDGFGFARLDKNEISKHFNEDSIKIFEGPKGFNFLEDTNNLHSGSIPKKGERILLTLEFMDFKSARLRSLDHPYICMNLLDG